MGLLTMEKWHVIIIMHLINKALLHRIHIHNMILSISSSYNHEPVFYAMSCRHSSSSPANFSLQEVFFKALCMVEQSC